MKRTISTLRTVALAAMAVVGAILLLGEEQDERVMPYVMHFIVDKAVGAAMIAAAWREMKRAHGVLKASVEE